MFYEPLINDIETAKYIIEAYSKFEELENMDIEKYYEMGSKDAGKEYTVIIRNITDEKTRDGSIQLFLSFYENTNIAKRADGLFYKIPEEFKEKIIDKLEIME